MPTPDIDNTPESIPVADTLPTQDTVPETLTPDQASEAITTGTDNPQPQIEQKVVNLVEVINRLQNLAVEQFFTPVDSDSEALAEQRAYFKENLTIDVEADNIVTAFAKLYCLDRFVGLSEDKLNEVYLLPPSEVFNRNLGNKPKLKLYFVETNYSTDLERDIADGQIAGIRLVEYEANTITRANAVALGEKIRDTFNGFIWQKGKHNLTYTDPDKGYSLQFLCDTKEGGLEVLTKVLSLRDHEVENKRVNFKENNAPDEAYPDTKEEVERLGRTIKKRVKRPICTVKLRAAFLYVDGLIKPDVLYDNSGYYPSPYVTDAS
ncbi:MAG: hypothetical protein ACKPCM_19895 [Pseudanabaena sp.]